MKMEAVVSVIIALIIALVVLVKSKSPSYEWTRTLYLVNSGETLWSICQEYCPDKMDIQEMLMAANDIDLSKLKSTIYYILKCK